MSAGAVLSLVLTASQVHWLNVAYNEGQKYGLPRYTQAIILVESSSCLNKRGDDGRSFGCGQLQVATARLVCGCNITRAALRDNNTTNIKISAAFLSQCFIRFWPDSDRATFCFNRGEPAASKATANQVDKSRYVRKVKAYLRQLQQIPVDTK